MEYQQFYFEDKFVQKKHKTTPSARNKQNSANKEKYAQQKLKLQKGA